MASHFVIINIILSIIFPNVISHIKPVSLTLLNRLKRQLDLLNQYDATENIFDPKNNNYYSYQNFATNVIPQQQYENNYDVQIPLNFANTKTSVYSTDHDNQNLFLPSFTKSTNLVSNAIDSPIYYVKLPPAPYKFLPGFGYISQSPLSILPFQLPPMTNPNYQPLLEPLKNSYINLPLEFLSNGKPTNILHLNNEDEFFSQQQQQPQQQLHQQQQLKGFNLSPITYHQTPYNSFSIPNQVEMLMSSFPKPSSSVSSKRNSLLKKYKNTLSFNGKPEHIRIHAGDSMENYESML